MAIYIFNLINRSEAELVFRVFLFRTKSVHILETFAYIILFFSIHFLSIITFEKLNHVIIFFILPFNSRFWTASIAWSCGTNLNPYLNYVKIINRFIIINSYCTKLVIISLQNVSDALMVCWQNLLKVKAAKFTSYLDSLYRLSR